ncbi:putative DNA polymerase sliding clamp [Cotonvirus japonicus]|uniref:DNA polymerase sliding clamp n=1 Tax=Cotonvirus japonicus TaxID=2811091 RepID=A0ABM7NTW2_9VIRU|nr:putative DNA polymerase sliding clamp [Cotonvirus japonicus]BCS83613.1 putative DNA polymerase sliding clamp [Cotonvirus japonicus]
MGNTTSIESIDSIKSIESSNTVKNPINVNNNILEFTVKDISNFKQTLNLINDIDYSIFNILNKTLDKFVCMEFYGDHTDVTEIGDKKALTILLANPMRPAMIKLDMYIDKFVSFWCEKPVLNVSLSIPKLMRILNFVGEDNPITFYIQKGNENVLYVKKTINTTTHVITKMHIYNIFTDHLNNFNYSLEPYETKIIMKPNIFQELINYFNGTIDPININIDKKTITLSSNGIFNVELVVDYSNNENIISDNFSPINGNYNYSTLKVFNQCDKLCENVEIYCKQQLPLVIVVPIINIGRLHVFLKYDDN